MPLGRPPRAAYAAWIAICVLWGTSLFAIKLCLQTMPPMIIGGTRYAVPGALLLAWARLRGETLPPVREWPVYAGIGFVMLAVGNGSLVIAALYVPSGVAAVLVATLPFWMIGVEAWLPGGEPLSRSQLAGLLVGFGGILLLVWPDLFTEGGIGWRFAGGVAALQLSCAGWAVGSIIGRRRAPRVSTIHAAGLQMFFGGLSMLVVATLLGEWPSVGFTVRSASALAYLTLMCSLAAFLAYVYALAHLPVSFVSLYAYVNPIIAVALGTWLLAEPFGPRIVVAMMVILASTAMVTAVTPRRSATPAPAGRQAPS